MRSNQIAHGEFDLSADTKVVRHIIRGMSKNHPIQQLLRYPYEWASAAAYFLACALVLMSPSILMGALNTPSLTYSIALGLALRGTQRFWETRKLLTYQYGLHVLPKYEIDSNVIPKSKENLFVGLGFEWVARHTQRRIDFDRLEFDHHKTRHEQLPYKFFRGFEKLFRRWAITAWLGWITSRESWVNPWAPIPYVEGVPAIHAVGLWEGENPINMRQAERVAHTLVAGTTRVGKTRLAEVFITQDIHNNDIVIVFDPKGDADLLKRMYLEAKKANRLHQFYVFHLGYPDISARYNPIGTFGRITEPASRIASQLPGEGASAAFREFTWRYVNVLSKTLTSLGETITYDNLLHYGADIDPLLYRYLEFIFDLPASEEKLRRAGVQNWRKALASMVEDTSLRQDKTQATRDRKAWAAAQIFKKADLRDPVANALVKTFEYEKSFYDKLVASLFPLLEKLTSGPARELLSPDYTNLDDPRPIFDWDEVIRTGGIVYVGLDALSDAEVAQAVGNSMFSDLTSRAGAIYKYGTTQGLSPELAALATTRKICLHADEFNELVGKEFIPMANKAGGAGFQLTVYTQTLSDIVARFGDSARAGQVIGNLGNLIMLRVKEPATAELLTGLQPEVEVNQLTLVSGVVDDTNPESFNDFVSNTQQRISSRPVPLIPIGDMMILPKGHAYAMLGGKLYKLRLPLFKDTSELPKNLDFLCTRMRETYSSNAANEEWYKLPDISAVS
ncbi:conjugative coupling factor TraD, PFGI-1 class [Cellvibrio zantedeschiae]|uniref:Conjugative coupling factor TraD, PFGI-1 class n=1 Tax=Cellvibrio zantedeschiae TaxID=1237077 RepID=A0ABQ3B5G1_9GAMM|nr:type IV conjugative transfer system coupling protein TraD [Cellvibrio zantedeschiae]GGY79089.1 conjugative coupling factor TraD, PFGI-1 class [Cellvibrio zantedeschiae]